MTKGNPRWVKERALCRPLGLLSALHKKVQRDCRKINELPRLLRRDCIYKAVKEGSDDSTQVRIEGVPENPQYNSTGQAVLAQSTGHVSVRIYGVRQDNFDVHMEWDGEELCCGLTVDGEKTDLNAISQRILETLGFP